MAKTKTSIALPKHILDTADWVADEVGVSRNDVVTFALAIFLREECGDEDVHFAFGAYDHEHDFRFQLEIRAKEMAEEALKKRFPGDKK